ncbi:hypothetical protein, partial [Clostridium perfringens]
MQIYKFRDLTVLENEKNKLVIACDSCGGIGENEGDFVKAENEIVSYFSARVCLFELLAFRAKPLVIVNNLGMSMNNGGEKIIQGINRAIKEYNAEDFFYEKSNLSECVTGSTEDNFKTIQTFLGLTIIGEKEENLKVNFEKGDSICLLGIPKVGQEVLEDINNNIGEIVTFKDFKILMDNKDVKDILPIGSKGIIHEISELEKSNKIRI